MTSLAQQLKRLQVPQSSCHAVERQQASLLFPLTAGKLLEHDRETVFAIGINGLEELQLLLPDFSRFTSTLFHQSSITMERSVHSLETNEKINVEVSLFLQYLSPFLLLKPAHKALEWLIHRFSIHMYNFDELMKCALPYHDTIMFVRIVQLLDLDGFAKRWNWLLDCQKSGYPLSKMALYNRCSSDVHFLKVICQYTRDVAKLNALGERGFLRTNILFYISTVLGVLEHSKEVSENLLTTLIPFLMAGLQSNERDYVAACYIIMAKLAKKVVVIQDVWHALLNASMLATNVCKDLLVEAVKCVAVICEFQKLPDLPDACLKQLLKSHARSSVAELSHRFRLSSLVQLLMRYQIKKTLLSTRRAISKATKWGKVFNWMTLNMKLSDDDIKCCARSILRTYGDIGGGAWKHPTETLEVAVNLLLALESRFVGEFDDLIENVVLEMTDVPSQAAARELIVMFQQKSSMAGSRPARIFLSLNHPSVARRKLALEEIAADPTLNLNEEIHWTRILERLADDYPSVVKTVLDSERLVECVRGERFTSLLLDIMDKCEKDLRWEEVGKLCTRLLSQVEVTEVSPVTWCRMIASLLPLYFPQDAQKFPLTGSRLTGLPSSFGAEQKEKTSPIRTLIPPFVVGAIATLPSEEKLNLMESLTSKDASQETVHKFFWSVILPFILGEIIAAEKDACLQLMQARIVVRYIGKQLSKDTATLRVDALHAVKHVLSFDVGAPSLDPFPLLWSLNAAIDAFTMPQEMNDVVWFTKDDARASDVLAGNVEVFQTLTESYVNNAIKKILVEKWSQECFDGSDNFLKFLVYLSTPVAGASPELQRHALNAIQDVARGTCDVGQLLTRQRLLEALLVALASANADVRISVLACIATFCEKMKQAVPFVGLFEAVGTRGTEIVECESALQTVLHEYFASGKRSATRDLCGLLNCITSDTEDALPDHILLGLLTCLDLVDNPTVLEKLVPVLDGILDCDSLSDERHNAAILIIRKFTPSSCKVFSTFPHAFSVLLKALCCCDLPPSPDLPSLQMATLTGLTKKFFTKIENGAFKQQLLQNLIDLQLDNDNHVVMQKLASVLRKLMVDGRQIKQELQRSMKHKVVAVFLKDLKKIKKTVVILEAIQRNCNVTHCYKLIPVLFKILEKFLERSDLVMIEYRKQLVLSALHNLWHLCQAETSGFSEDMFNIELVIRCIRMSTSPKTHQEALQLLSLAARLHPDRVVRSAMAIFTFMGEDVVRQDDSYSFGVLISTVKALVQAIKKIHNIEGSGDKSIFSLIRIFVDALPDIPGHRQMPLFSCLISALGEQHFLWVIVALVFEKLIAFTKVANRQKSSFSRMDVLTFAVQLCNLYKPLCQVKSCQQIMGCVINLENNIEPDHTMEHPPMDTRGSAEEQSPSSGMVLNLQLQTTKLQSQFRIVATEFISMLLSSQSFLNQVVKLQEVDSKRMTREYRHLLEKVLLSASKATSEMESDPRSLLIKYWKVLQHRTYELLDKLSSLLPSSMYTTVINELLKEANMVVKRKAMEILVLKLQRPHNHFDTSDHNTLCEMVPTLFSIVETEEQSFTSNINEEVNMVSNRQMALLALKHLCHMLGTIHPDVFEKVLLGTLAVVCNGHEHDHIRASALLYVAEHCCMVQIHVISHLSVLMPALFSVLEDMEKLSKVELLLLSVVTALQKFLEKACRFLSPYLDNILEKLCCLSMLSPENDKSPLVQRLAAVRQHIATTVAPRILIPAIMSCFETFLQSNAKAINPLMSVLHKLIVHADKDDLTLRHKQLVDLFFIMLDYRAEHQNDDLLVETEGHIMEPLLAMILKMSEATFRPFLVKLFNWATQVPVSRSLTFYRIAGRLADNLKSLFVLFAGIFVKNAATLLDSNNPTKTKDLFFAKPNDARAVCLVHYILDCLRKCFEYDNEGFVNKECFNILFQPIVDHIDNVSSDYEDLISNHVAPCVAQLAYAANNSDLWLSLNGQVMLKTRNQSPKVRFGALQVLLQMTKVIGHQFITLLPDTIPYLSELMEDESQEVEHLSRAIVKELESTLGEQLQSYF